MNKKRCPRCGQIQEGNYCSQCGCALEPIPDPKENDEEMFRQVEKGLTARWDQSDRYREDSDDRVSDADDKDYEDDDYDYEDDRNSDSYDDYEDDDDRRSEERRNHRRFVDSDRIWESGSKVMNTAGDAVGKGFRRMWVLLCTLLRWGSALLMVASTLLMGWGFFAGFRSVDELRGILSGDNPGTLLYLGIALALTVFAALQILWILKLGHRKVDGKKIAVDKGHGIFAFLIFTAAVMLAGIILPILPEKAGTMAGVRSIVVAFREMGNPFFMVNALGLILSVLRRLCGSL